MKDLRIAGLDGTEHVVPSGEMAILADRISGEVLYPGSDGGLASGMSRLDRVSLDVDAFLVRIGPGCSLGDVDRETQFYGLATTLGFVSETGVAGLSLGDGVDYLTRRSGWIVDDLEAVWQAADQYRG